MAMAVQVLGYPETTVRDVLERAGMSRRTFLVVESVRAGPSGLDRHERTTRELVRRIVRAQPGARLEEDCLMLGAEAGVGAVHRIVQARIVDGRAGELTGLAPEQSRVMRELALEA